MKQSLIDITPKMGVRTPVYPGDPPFVVRLTASVAAGDPADVSAVSFSAHCGAHVDAPAHLFPGTGDAASLPLERFVGPCLVIDLTELEPEAAPSELVRLQTIAAVKALMDGKALPSRVLIKTRRSQPPVWSSDFRALSPECVEAFLAECVEAFLAEGVELVGVDVPSIDPADSEELLAHRIALSRGLTVMENLDLSAVMAGSYELIALPLPLEGVEASPVRAVLRSIP